MPLLPVIFLLRPSPDSEQRLSVSCYEVVEMIERLDIMLDAAWVHTALFEIYAAGSSAECRKS